MAFNLMNLPYPQNALEPYISAQTLFYHYEKHHATYLKNLNELIKESPLTDKTLEAIIIETQNHPSEQTLFNNASQVWNHDFYWKSLNPTSKKENHIPEGDFLEKIKQDFGGENSLKDSLKETALGQFGSGWCWLVNDTDTGRIKVIRTSNAQSPLGKEKPLLCIDVWEHAYYLDYQNKRADYLTRLIDNLLNWDFAIQNNEE